MYRPLDQLFPRIHRLAKKGPVGQCDEKGSFKGFQVGLGISLATGRSSALFREVSSHRCSAVSAREHVCVGMHRHFGESNTQATNLNVKCSILSIDLSVIFLQGLVSNVISFCGASFLSRHRRGAQIATAARHEAVSPP